MNENKAHNAAELGSRGVHDEDDWRHLKYSPTEEDRATWSEVRIPNSDAIISGFLLENPVAYNVPDKLEIFRLADTIDDSNPYSDTVPLDGDLHLKVAKAMPFCPFILQHPHIVDPMGTAHELNYIVHLQVVVTDMVLSRIKVISGSRTDDSEQIVFEGTEFPGSFAFGKIRVIRITIHSKDFATYEVASETKYPVRGLY